MKIDKKFIQENDPATLELNEAKRKVLLSILGLLIYIAALVLGFIWFDWKLIVFLILFCWGNNLGMITSTIMPLQKSIALLLMKDKVSEEIDKTRNSRR